MLAYDAKRLHYFEQLFHAADGWVSATSENLSLHVDMTSRKTAAFPQEISARLAEMKASHALLPVPEAAGRRIGIPARSCRGRAGSVVSRDLPPGQVAVGAPARPVRKRKPKRKGEGKK